MTETIDTAPSTFDPQAETIDTAPSTFDPQARTADPRARTVDPQARTADPQARTADPQARTLRFTAPNASTSNIPPGYYMLFYVDCMGKPSRAQMVRFDDRATAP